jgi:hypothetical protein
MSCGIVALAAFKLDCISKYEIRRKRIRGPRGTRGARGVRGARSVRGTIAQKFWLVLTVIVYLLFLISASSWLGASYCVCYVTSKCNKTLQVLTVSWTKKRHSKPVDSILRRYKSLVLPHSSFTLFPARQIPRGKLRVTRLTKCAVLSFAAPWQLGSRSLRKAKLNTTYAQELVLTSRRE